MFTGHVFSSNEKRGGKEVARSCSGIAFFIPVSWYIYTSFTPKVGGVTPYLYWTGISIWAGSFTLLDGQK